MDTSILSQDAFSNVAPLYAYDDFAGRLQGFAVNPSTVAGDASVMATNVYDSLEVPNLLHGGERWLYGDRAYQAKAQRERLKAIGPKVEGLPTNVLIETAR